jgi:hypothetical protein
MARSAAATAAQSRRAAMESGQPHRLAASKDAAMNAIRHADAAFELRFQPLFETGRALGCPCDPQGNVDLDGLSERARGNYFFARSLIGRDYAQPAVLCRTLH